MATRDSSDRQDITLENFQISLRKAFAVYDTASVKDAVDSMDHYDVDQVLVGDPGEGPMVVTRRMIAAAQLTEWGETPVRVLVESSTDPRRWLPATTSLAAAAEELIKHDWVITTDERDKPVGLATVGDALKEALAHL